MHSRYEIGLEQYVLTVGVEAKLTLEIGSTKVLPAAVRFQTELALNLQALLAAGVEADRTSLDSVSVPLAELRAAADVLEGVVADDLWPLPTYQEMLYIL